VSRILDGLTAARQGGKAEGVEEPAETAVATALGQELAQLAVDDWAGLAEELIAEFEQLSGDLRGRSTKLGVRIGCVSGHELDVHAGPFQDGCSRNTQIGCLFTDHSSKSGARASDVLFELGDLLLQARIFLSGLSQFLCEASIFGNEGIDSSEKLTIVVLVELLAEKPLSVAP
jgi:hypothetical protein